MAAEDCDKVGLQVPSFTSETTKTLREMLPSRCSCGNPTDLTDLITSGNAVTFPCLWTILEDPNVDAAMLLGGVGAKDYFSSIMGTGSNNKASDSDREKFQQLIEHLDKEELKNIDITMEKVEQLQKPLVFVNLIPRTIAEPESFKLLRKKGIPVYPNPKRAAKVLKHLFQYNNYLKGVTKDFRS